MSIPARYEAFRAPGLGDDIDTDVSLRAGFQWLEAMEANYGAGVVVMYAKSMADNRPLLRQAASKWAFVSPRSASPRDYGPVLAIWPPDAKVLEYAESLALDRCLCVIAGHYDIAPWVKKAGAVCLIKGWQSESRSDALPKEVMDQLDSMLAFDGHNGFVGAGGKEDAIRTLQGIAKGPNRPDAQSIEDYLTASGETSAAGVTRARKWYDEILGGKQHRDCRGRVI